MRVNGIICKVKSAILMAVALGLSAGPTAAQKLYKWVDKDGNVHYSDQVPPDQVDQARQELTEQGVVVDRMDRAPTAEELEAMKADRYDYAPVLSKGRVVGYVGRGSLRRTEPDQPIRNITRSLAGGSIVSGDTPIHDLMQWIPKQRILFVLEGREVTGFVTVWDFNKQPARAYFYLVLAGLEIALQPQAHGAGVSGGIQRQDIGHRGCT